MEQKTKKTLNSALEGLLKRLEKGEKFVLAQAPAICKELVTEMLIDSATWMVVGFVPLVIGFLMITGSCEHQSNTSILHGFGWLVTGIGAIATLAVIHDLLVLKLCPKISVIRKIRDLLSTRKD